MNILDELSGDNESEPFVLNESVLALNRLWMNETNSPDILIYNEDLIHPLMKDLKAQQDLIDQKLHSEDEDNDYFLLTLYQMDIERIRYSLSRYHRTRLMKIEKHLEYIISNIDITDKLSYQEKLYATKLNQLNNNYYDDNVVNRFLTTDTKEYYLNSTNRLKQAQISTKSFVFCQAKTDIADLQIGDQSRALNQSDIAILQYDLIRDYFLRDMFDIL